MPQATRDIKRRINSVANTKKITKAMEMVAAAKMRKAVDRVLASRNYSNSAWQTILHLASKSESNLHPLLKSREVKKVALVLISSNRGLCGGFNSQIVQKAVDSIKKFEDKVKETHIITLGSRGRDSIARYNYKVEADFEKKDLTASISDINIMSQFLINEFVKGSYDKIMIAYTDFISSINQRPRVMQLLPLKVDSQDEYLGEVTSFGEKKSQQDKKKDVLQGEFIFEPSAKEVLDYMLPRLVETLIYQSVLESDASEHSARMMAMRNASDAATEMIDELTLAFNKARQASITQEIAEISAGKAALEE